MYYCVLQDCLGPRRPLLHITNLNCDSRKHLNDVQNDTLCHGGQLQGNPMIFHLANIQPLEMPGERILGETRPYHSEPMSDTGISRDLSFSGVVDLLH